MSKTVQEFESPDTAAKAAEQMEAIFTLKGLGGQTLYQLVSEYSDNFTATNENNSEKRSYCRLFRFY